MPASPTEAAGLHALLPALRWTLAVLILVAVPLLVISTNVRLLTLDRQFYLDGFAKHEASARTGLSAEQLERVAESFIDYFQAPRGRMDVQVVLAGERRALFNERELAHMEDVQMLVQGFSAAQWLSAAVLLAALAVGLALWKLEFLPLLGKLCLGAAALTIALPLLVALFSLLDFHSLWIGFHLVSFRNDLWILDPARDYLIMLFPLGFWFDATIRLAAQTAFGAALAALLGAGLLLLAPLSSKLQLARVR
jgi:integral membrane protein (TIGR01906 family)